MGLGIPHPSPPPPFHEEGIVFRVERRQLMGKTKEREGYERRGCLDFV